MPGLQPRDGQRDLDDLARALLALDERRPAGDAFSLDVRVRLTVHSRAGRGLCRRLRQRDRSRHPQHGGYH